jgi:hypothetical protein
LRLEALVGDRDQVVTDAVAAGLAKQLLDRPLALCVSAFTELVVPDSPLGVGDVHGGPVPVAERPPNRIVAVERDRILDRHVPGGLADVVDVALERELGRVDADHHEALICVLLGPRAHISERAQPVDAGVRPEIDEDDLPSQALGSQRGRIEPAGGSVEAGQVALGGQVHPKASRPHG